MNSLRGQVIYRQDAFSYNFLQQIKDAIVPLLATYEISIVGIDEKINSVKVYLACEINAESLKRHLRDIGLFEESALAFTVDKGVVDERNTGPAFSGERIVNTTLNRAGSIGANAMCNVTGRLGVLTNEHVVGVGHFATYGGIVVPTLNLPF